MLIIWELVETPGGPAFYRRRTPRRKASMGYTVQNGRDETSLKLSSDVLHRFSSKWFWDVPECPSEYAESAPQHHETHRLIYRGVAASSSFHKGDGISGEDGRLILNEVIMSQWCLSFQDPPDLFWFGTPENPIPPLQSIAPWDFRTKNHPGAMLRAPRLRPWLPPWLPPRLPPRPAARCCGDVADEANEAKIPSQRPGNAWTMEESYGGIVLGSLIWCFNLTRSCRFMLRLPALVAG